MKLLPFGHLHNVCVYVYGMNALNFFFSLVEGSVNRFINDYKINHDQEVLQTLV